MNSRSILLTGLLIGLTDCGHSASTKNSDKPGVAPSPAADAAGAKPADPAGGANSAVNPHVTPTPPQTATTTPPTSSNPSLAVNADTSWGGSVALTGDATIASGATLTIVAGSKVAAGSGFKIIVRGKLVIDGTPDRVSLGAAAAGSQWGGISIAQGGSAVLTGVDISDATYGVDCGSGAVVCTVQNSTVKTGQTGLSLAGPATVEKTTVEDNSSGAILVLPGATVTISDSIVRTTQGDLITQRGGSMSVQHSTVGGPNYQHCAFHIEGGDVVVVSANDITSSVYGMMIGGIAAASINGNNFTNNQSGQDILKIGTVSSIDLTGNYWDHGAPNLGAGFDTSKPSPLVVASTGPRSP